MRCGYGAFAFASRAGDVNGKAASEVFCMTCRDFQDVVVELARERELAGQVDAAALAHAASCADGGRRLADERALTAGLAALALDARHRGAPQRVEERLLKAVGRSSANQRRR